MYARCRQAPGIFYNTSILIQIMKTIKVNLYRFEELSDKAKQKALEAFWDINVNHDWWDFVYDDFKQLCSYFGLTVDLERTYFSGFYHQGQGCGYTATIDFMTMLACIKNQSWKEYAPNAEFCFPDIDINRRLQQLIDAGIIDIVASVKPGSRGTNINVSTDASYSSNMCSNYDRINEELSKLEEITDKICKELNSFLFKNLLEDYEYLTSEDAVRETIQVNEYDFGSDGQYFVYHFKGVD